LAALDAGVANVADVRVLGRALGGFSPAMVAAERDLKRFMYRTLYHHPSQMAAAGAARDVVTSLFIAYQGEPGAMGGDWAAALPDDETGRARHIADYIAGMTDRFALDRFAELFGKEAVPGVLRQG
jgi:dGTPase